MSFFQPNARLKLYTKLSHYSLVFLSLISFKFNKGNSRTDLIKKFSALTRKKHCIPVPMGRVGIYLSVKAIINAGQEVILSPYTIADVVNMVVAAGGKPVFADISENTCNMTPGNLKPLINENTGLVLVTHFYGELSDLSSIEEICKNANIPFIEDAAQALGTIYDGKMGGTFGTCGVYSFGMYKNITSFYGGMIVTDDSLLADKVNSMLSIWPVQSQIIFIKKVLSGLLTDIVTSKVVFSLFVFKVFRWAFNNDIDIVNNKLKIDVDPKLIKKLPNAYMCNMSELQAKLVLKQLCNLEFHTDKRIELSKLWHEGLCDIKEITIPRFIEDKSHMYWYFPLQYKNRKDLVCHVLQNGFDITESYHRNCSTLECFSDYKADCPQAELTANSLIYLPTYPGYPKEQIALIIKSIRSYFCP